MIHKPHVKKRLSLGKRVRLRRVGLHEEAAERLRTLIVRGELKPGAQLNEMALSNALRVSRAPLREALKLLAAEGLVELRRNRSSTVHRLAVPKSTNCSKSSAGSGAWPPNWPQRECQAAISER